MPDLERLLTTLGVVLLVVVGCSRYVLFREALVTDKE